MGHRFTVVSASALLIASATWACSARDVPATDDGGNVTPAISTIDPRARLDELDRAWRRTAATITYRTIAPVPGQPDSTHQCLRQMAGGAIDRWTALRMCSRQGRLILTWDPPDRWRMDVTSPVDRYRIVSGPTGGSVCPIPLDQDRACRRVPEDAARGASPFGFIFTTVDRTLVAIGADAVAVTPAEVAGRPVECFEASGDETRVEWCFSPEGLLLSFLTGSGGGAWTEIEAMSVSRES